MKLAYCLLAGVLSICASATRAAETANATLFCYSLQFQRGIDPNGNYYLDLSSLNGSVNGELAPDFLASGYTHSAYITLTDELLGDTLSGEMAVDVPSGGDANGDGFPDFFQVSQGVTNLASSGVYNLQIYGNGNLTASWNRPAGSNYGTAVFTMNLMPFQPVNFNVAFEVLEYKGPLSYTPGATNVNGNLRLVQTGNPTSLLNGPAQFVKVPTNRFNQLTLQSAAWTNESQQPMNYTNNLIERDPRWPTNYYGYVQFFDPSNPGAFYPYGLWMLSIDDTNDWNHNGIPDFSDDPRTGTLPQPPQLELVLNATNLVITVHGDVGNTHEIQTISDLGSTNWQTAATLTLTNNPQQVTLPLPTNATVFWRARAR